MVAVPSTVPDDAEEIAVAAFTRYVGPLYRLADGDDAAIRRFAFVVAEHHLNAAGTVHGGMLMMLADVAMGQTARRAAGGKVCSTVSLNCDFVGPGKPGDLVEARVRVTRASRTMIFLSGDIVAGDRVLLVATGLWKIIASG
jgi:uncharacterized protein (TIGR00369 family)